VHYEHWKDTESELSNIKGINNYNKYEFAIHELTTSMVSNPYLYIYSSLKCIVQNKIYNISQI